MGANCWLALLLQFSLQDNVPQLREACNPAFVSTDNTIIFIGRDTVKRA
jgi:hypothetical protein